jgi:hypothetical protein
VLIDVDTKSSFKSLDIRRSFVSIIKLGHKVSYFWGEGKRQENRYCTIEHSLTAYLICESPQEACLIPSSAHLKSSLILLKSHFVVVRFPL